MDIHGVAQQYELRLFLVFSDSYLQWMNLCTSNLVNWNIYFKCINCDPGQKDVRGDPSVSHKICTHQEEKVLHLVAPTGVGPASGCALRIWWMEACTLVASGGVGAASGCVLRIWRVAGCVLTPGRCDVAS